MEAVARRGGSSGEETVWIHEPAKSDESRTKEVKVKIPIGHHVKLHSMKVLTGKQISDAVTEALDAYFASSRFHDAIAPPDALDESGFT